MHLENSTAAPIGVVEVAIEPTEGSVVGTGAILVGIPSVRLQFVARRDVVGTIGFVLGSPLGCEGVLTKVIVSLVPTRVLTVMATVFGVVRRGRFVTNTEILGIDARR